jgi:predicted membrane-bound mannosyltransferase
MLLADNNYPLGGVFWTLLVFFAWVFWLILAFRVFGDLFRRHDLSGIVKVAWTVLVIVMPFIGVFAYLLVYHTGMAEREQAATQAAQTQLDDYVRSVAHAGGPASEIEKAKKLLEDGTITQTEFEQLKAKALAHG